MIKYESPILGGGAEADGDSWDRYPRIENEKWECGDCGNPYNNEWDEDCRCGSLRSESEVSK
jgi:hypothetical protein